MRSKFAQSSIALSMKCSENSEVSSFADYIIKQLFNSIFAWQQELSNFVSLSGNSDLSIDNSRCNAQPHLIIAQYMDDTTTRFFSAQAMWENCHCQTRRSLMGIFWLIFMQLYLLTHLIDFVVSIYCSNLQLNFENVRKKWERIEQHISNLEIL